MPPEEQPPFTLGNGSTNSRPDELLPEGVYNAEEFRATKDDLKNILERQYRRIIRMEMGADRWLPQMKGYAKKHKEAIARYKQANYPDGQIPPIDVGEQSTS